MEEQVKAHEKWVSKVKDGAATEAEWRYHTEMVRNFQHERAVHLAIMLFCIAWTFILLGVSAWMLSVVTLVGAAPVLVATAILAVLSGFYVKHYYFLENHIQNFYKETGRILKKD